MPAPYTVPQYRDGIAVSMGAGLAAILAACTGLWWSHNLKVLICCGFLIPYALWHLSFHAKAICRRVPALVIDDEGIFDGMTYFSLMQLKWSEVDSVAIEVAQKRWRWLTITLKHPDQMLKTLPKYKQAAFERQKCRVMLRALHLAYDAEVILEEINLRRPRLEEATLLERGENHPSIHASSRHPDVLRPYDAGPNGGK